ncbi:YbaK/EbsC family protein [Brevibacillus borstelensis]|uniref:YbaK/EbsC family protein n=1 Tax=Brevibacillus borstelensis TaxID=45462 RepID=UPI003D1ACDD0
MSNPLERVSRFIKQYDPAIEPLIFQEKLNTTEEAAQALGVEAGQIAKSILFRCSDRYGLFVAAGDVRIHPKRVKKCLEGGQPKMASPDEVAEITGFQVGAVCPFALQTEVPVFVDSSLERFPVVYTAAGIAESLLPVSFQALVEMTGARVIDAQSAE